MIKKNKIFVDNPKRIACPSFIGFTEDGTLLVNGNDEYLKQHREQKWVKLDRRFKGKKRIYRKMNVDGVPE